MSSFNTHKRAVMYENQPLPYRASHLRSCANKVANSFGLSREAIISLVFQKVGVDLNRPENSSDLIIGLSFLDGLRFVHNTKK